MKKIQFSTVEKQCNVEIIELNTYFISRAIKAQLKMQSALEGTKNPIYEKDSEGNTLKDANGNKVQKKDEKGNLVYSYDRYLKNEESVKKMHEALEFLNELCEGFEE
jgi:predicted ATPase